MHKTKQKFLKTSIKRIITKNNGIILLWNNCFLRVKWHPYSSKRKSTYLFLFSIYKQCDYPIKANSYFIGGTFV